MLWYGSFSLPILWFNFHCSSFDTSKTLFSHVVNEHVPRDSLVMSCLWEGCPPVRRSRSSLLFHLQVKLFTFLPKEKRNVRVHNALEIDRCFCFFTQQKHSEPSPVPGAVPPQPPPAQQQTPQPPPTSVSNPHVPAYHFLARMLQSLQVKKITGSTRDSDIDRPGFQLSSWRRKSFSKSRKTFLWLFIALFSIFISFSRPFD